MDRAPRDARTGGRVAMNLIVLVVVIVLALVILKATHVI